MKNGRERIRTSEGVRQQIYSLPPLATWVLAPGQLMVPAPGGVGKNVGSGLKAAGRTRTADLKITNHVLFQLSYGGREQAGYADMGKGAIRVGATTPSGFE